MDLNKDIYNYHPAYAPQNLWVDPTNVYDKHMMELRRKLLFKFAIGKDVLDLCCGSGTYLIPVLDRIRTAVGVDFSSNMLKGFREVLGNDIPANLTLIESDAASLPLADCSIDFIFSFASLYYVPEIKNVLKEISRVLRPDGIVAIELGNLYSLNTLISSSAHEESGWAKSYHVSYSNMRRYLREVELEVVEWRCFQLSPMYGTTRKYKWLYPIVHPRWKKIMGIMIAGRMFDEWISSRWPLRYFAFRHLIVARKK